MAKASLAPPAAYRRHYYVTEHAVQQFRERHPKGHTMLHRFNDDVGNLIDWACNDQWEERLVCRDTRDDTTMHIIDLQPVLDDELWALIKDNESGQKGNRLPLAVVTILSRDMVDSYQKTGRWVTSDGKPVEILKPMLTSRLADKLKGVTVTPPKPAPLPPPKAAPVAPPPASSLPPLPLEVGEDARLLQYTTAYGPQYEILSKPEALNRVMELKGAGVTNIHVWRPVKVKVIVEEE